LSKTYSITSCCLLSNLALLPEAGERKNLLEATLKFFATSKCISKWPQAPIVWAQEEPRNMGAWGHLLMHFEVAKNFRVASRRFYGSPASGSKARFDKRQQEVIEYVFDKSKNNMK
jgi:hypothetical protein